MSIYKKLLEIQKAVSGIGKDSENPFFHSKYFDINKMLAVLKPELNKRNLLLMQPLSNVDGKPSIKTILYDVESDGIIMDETMLTINPDPQKMGSSITYFRRYALQSLLGLEAKDDDANSASGKTIPDVESVEVLKKRIEKAFDVLNYSEGGKLEMSEEYLGDNPVAEDYEILLKKLTNEYKIMEKNNG